MILVSMLLVAAPVDAEPAPASPAGAAGIHIDILELTIGGIGGVDPTILRRAADDTVAAAYRCYDSAKSRPAKLRATVTLKFRIDEHGAVAKASAFGLLSVDSCIATAVKTLAFNTPSKGALEVTEKLSFWTPTTSGILGSTRDQGGAFTSLTGTADLSSGFDDTTISGGLLGNEADARGGWGYGRASNTGRVIDGEPSAPADKTAIRTSVRQHIAKLKACYELHLGADPQLAGTVTVVFRIEPDGTVSSATGTGLKNVDECVAKEIAAIAFPKPSTGGVIDVSYPFSFKPDANGGPNGRLRGPSAAVPTVVLGQPTAQGELDKAIIRRYIKRNLQKVQYCYEKQLMDKPRLAGTLEIEFAIDGDGKVISSTASGVDPTVARCVAEVIQHIEFPKPKDHGVVQVSYPLVFRADDKKP
jgi:hypothetical protein